MFPEVKFNDGEPLTQLKRIGSEIEEAIIEYEAGNKQKALLETIDIIHASVNVLYKADYTNREISDAVQSVIEKNKHRDYYK